jgi:hypothetical protein
MQSRTPQMIHCDDCGHSMAHFIEGEPTKHLAGELADLCDYEVHGVSKRIATDFVLQRTHICEKCKTSVVTLEIRKDVVEKHVLQAEEAKLLRIMKSAVENAIAATNGKVSR